MISPILKRKRSTMPVLYHGMTEVLLSDPAFNG